MVAALGCAELARYHASGIVNQLSPDRATPELRTKPGAHGLRRSRTVSDPIASQRAICNGAQ
jgi:hypothetical protein